MDIFFYWQKFEQNMKSNTVGYFVSSSPKLTELSDRLPKRIWAFKTPKGMKGAVQLVGSLLVCDKPRVAAPHDQPYIVYYDPFAAESVIFTDSASHERVRDVSAIFQYRLRPAFSSNFQGDAGLQAIESNVARELEALVDGWDRRQMLECVKDRNAVRPINPFAEQTH
jgi:hypothetical protein